MLYGQLLWVPRQIYSLQHCSRALNLIVSLIRNGDFFLVLPNDILTYSTLHSQSWITVPDIVLEHISSDIRPVLSQTIVTLALLELLIEIGQNTRSSYTSEIVTAMERLRRRNEQTRWSRQSHYIQLESKYRGESDISRKMFQEDSIESWGWECQASGWESDSWDTKRLLAEKHFKTESICVVRNSARQHAEGKETLSSSSMFANHAKLA
jgi:hypothetical protein